MPWVPRPPDDETAAASWYADGLAHWPEPDGTARVRSFVPAGFDAYVRVFHPPDPDRDMARPEGELPNAVWLALADHLRPHTTTPDHILHGVWEGRHPATLPAYASMPRLAAPHRRYLVFAGDLGGPSVRGPGGEPFVTNARWAADHAWCVVTEIDSMSTYVGCSAACAQALLEDGALDAVAATPADRMDHPRRA
jgi:hypothetical protein